MDMLCELKKLQVHLNKLGLNNSESIYGTYIIKFKIGGKTYTGILNIHDDVNVIPISSEEVNELFNTGSSNDCIINNNTINVSVSSIYQCDSIYIYFKLINNVYVGISFLMDSSRPSIFSLEDYSSYYPDVVSDNECTYKGIKFKIESKYTQDNEYGFIITVSSSSSI